MINNPDNADNIASYGELWQNKADLAKYGKIW